MAKEHDRLAELEARNTALMAELEAKSNAEPPPDWEAKLAAMEARMAVMSGAGGLTREDFLSGLKAVTAGTELLASKTKPENVDHLHMGPFEHPLGGLTMPKPTLLRETWFAGTPVRVHEINYPEALAVNALNASLARGQRRVCRNGKWKAVVSDDDASLMLSIPMRSLDDRQDLPSFLQIMQELTSGERSKDTGELASELALMRMELDRLKAAAA